MLQSNVARIRFVALSLVAIAGCSSASEEDARSAEQAAVNCEWGSTDDCPFPTSSTATSGSTGAGGEGVTSTGAGGEGVTSTGAGGEGVTSSTGVGGTTLASTSASTGTTGTGGAACSLPNGFSGRAVAAYADLIALPPLVISDTGELPAQGGVIEKGLDVALGDVVSLEVLSADTSGAGATSASSASVAKLGISFTADLVGSLGLGDLLGGILGQGQIAEGVSARVLYAESNASCEAGAPVVSADSSIAELAVLGIHVDVTPGLANQVISVGLITIHINEQELSVDGNHGFAAVNALRVEIPFLADVIVAHAESGIDCLCP